MFPTEMIMQHQRELGLTDEQKQFMRSEKCVQFVTQACKDFEPDLAHVDSGWIAGWSPIGWSFGHPGSGTENLPVVGVLGYQADAYARWAGKALPRETAWEKAARGIDGRAFVHGNVFRPGATLATELLPNGSRPVDVSVYGVHDMMASVPEWTRTALEQSHVVRGGKYESTMPADLRLAIRRENVPAGLRSIAPAPDLEVERRDR